jgi:hypothetical protein
MCPKPLEKALTMVMCSVKARPKVCGFGDIAAWRDALRRNICRGFYRLIEAGPQRLVDTRTWNRCNCSAIVG